MSTRYTQVICWAGVRSATYARTTGTLVVVLDGEAQGLDTEGGRWYTICDDHSFLVTHTTLRDALGWKAHPEEWCETCQENQP